MLGAIQSLALQHANRFTTPTTLQFKEGSLLPVMERIFIYLWLVSGAQIKCHIPFTFLPFQNAKNLFKSGQRGLLGLIKVLR